MTTLAKWYKEGLLDPDFAAQDGKTYDAKITGGRVGVWFALAGSGIGRYTDTARPENPNFEITGGPWPTLNKGDIPLTGQKDHAYSGGASAAITTQCKEVEIAAKWLDYAYSEEGHMLFNFGIEGESYEMVDGYPKYTEYIVNNPEGLPMGYAMGRYMKSNYGGPFIQDRRYMEQYLKYPEQVKAIEIWSQHKGLLTVPPITPTPDESQRLSSIMNEINTYVDEMFLKFVMGQESLDNFDTYVEQIKKIKAVNDISLPNSDIFIEELKPIARLSGSNTVSEMKYEIMDILKKICEYVESTKKDRNQKIIEQIIAIIEENYMNPNLSISNIAGNFGLTGPYVSKIFRDHMGEGIQDYINRVRLKRAKILLQKQHLNLEQIAYEVGYSNSNGLIRVFKKYEGITPGRFREMLS